MDARARRSSACLLFLALAQPASDTSAAAAENGERFRVQAQVREVRTSADGRFVVRAVLTGATVRGDAANRFQLKGGVGCAPQDGLFANGFE